MRSRQLLRKIVQRGMLGGLLLGGLLLEGFLPHMALADSAPSGAPPSVSLGVPPEVRRAEEDLTRILAETRTLAAAFVLLRDADLPYEPDVVVPTRFVRECRRGRALTTLLGLYRADQAYAGAFAQPELAPVRETLEQAQLSPSVVKGLERVWAETAAQGRGDAQDTRTHPRQTLLVLSSFDDVRAVVDIVYGSLLEQTHIVCASLLRMPPEKWSEPLFASAVWAVIRRMDAFRRVLQSWASSPLLVRELGVHSDLTLLDRVQADLELLVLQPTAGLAQAALHKVNGEREDLVRLCKIPPKEERGPFWKLQPREDLFKPRNFF